MALVGERNSNIIPVYTKLAKSIHMENKECIKDYFTSQCCDYFVLIFCPMQDKCVTNYYSFTCNESKESGLFGIRAKISFLFIHLGNCR